MITVLYIITWYTVLLCHQISHAVFRPHIIHFYPTAECVYSIYQRCNSQLWPAVDASLSTQTWSFAHSSNTNTYSYILGNVRPWASHIYGQTLCPDKDHLQPLGRTILFFICQHKKLFEHNLGSRWPRRLPVSVFFFSILSSFIIKKRMYSQFIWNKPFQTCLIFSLHQ